MRKKSMQSIREITSSKQVQSRIFPVLIGSFFFEDSRISHVLFFRVKAVILPEALDLSGSGFPTNYLGSKTRNNQSNNNEKGTVD
ncbi:hypothetical protein PoB_004327800 [Plakobranchus ocellatus]|uniref:Uncharacterized protein n=1 Tax=Plakobranchus ocellatus TaxID=259542 RepID=A0AAV4BC80_9GAST|nr:hypothetical protein PoB_004327800 [Plakobranchus ocellatus]